MQDLETPEHLYQVIAERLVIDQIPLDRAIATLRSMGCEGVVATKMLDTADGILRRPVPVNVQKRDGTPQAFYPNRIKRAARRAIEETGEGEAEKSVSVMWHVLFGLAKEGITQPSVEDIQDRVEKAFMALELPVTAKAFILYRERRAISRSSGAEDNTKAPK